ncbi:MAG: glycosyltransferase family 2 protein [Candidatus Woesebacteria bacterium]|nr:glycosyltransferase family 2 protein [Candidatus Woesebacteria bacterium]
MKVSVVIPAYNEEKFIKKCLVSVVNQIVPADEIIVVNNNCTDRTEAIAEKFGVRIVYEKKQGMTPARNRGFNSARFEIIARCDADTVVPKDWIKKIKNNFEKKRIDALTGPVFFNDSKLFKSNSTVAAHLAWKSFKFISNGRKYLIGPNMSLTKDIWEKVKDVVNLDDKKVHEDMDLSLKIAKVHGRIGYDRSLIVGISARRLKKHPESFFLEYPVRIVKTLLANKK